MLDSTKAGIAGRELYGVAAKAYAAVGFDGEELQHHQGGAIGYSTRDWIAHPACDEQVHDCQAFAWNPSITGTKAEDTALLVDGRVELLTSSPDWPSLEMSVGGQSLPAAAILPL